VYPARLKTKKIDSWLKSLEPRERLERGVRLQSHICQLRQIWGTTHQVGIPRYTSEHLVEVCLVESSVKTALAPSPSAIFAALITFMLYVFSQFDLCPRLQRPSD